VTAITVADMVEMGFALGDRRKLQRAISKSCTPRTTMSVTRQEPRATNSSKRQYRRHPQADPIAPPRPKSAYLVFGEQARNESALQRMSFAETAKETGRRWQDLSHTERSNIWEKPAAKKLQQYKDDLKEYEKTQEFRNHQSYLASFNKSQGQPESSASASRMSMTLESKEADQSSTLSGDEEELCTAESSEFTPFDLRAPEDSNISPLQGGMEEVNHIYTSLGVGSRSSQVTPYPPGILHNLRC
jgi:hypothetical protein